MMHKLCVIASDTTDIIQHKKNGLIFPVKNRKSLEEMILLLDDFRLRKEIMRMLIIS